MDTLMGYVDSRKASRDGRCSSSSAAPSSHCDQSLTYDDFVRHLDVDDAVAIKALELLAKDVYSRVKKRKLAISAVTTARDTTSLVPHVPQIQQPQQPSQALLPSISANADMDGVLAHMRAQRAQVAEHQLRQTNRYRDISEDYVLPAPPADLPIDETTRRRQEAAEFDAILAEASRRIASPLPYIPPLLRDTTVPPIQPVASVNTVPVANPFEDSNGVTDPWTMPLYDDSYLSNRRRFTRRQGGGLEPLNPGLSNWYESDTSQGSDSDSDDTRAEQVASTLAFEQSQRDDPDRRTYRGSTLRTDADSSIASRHRIIERLEQRRRERAERAADRRREPTSSQYVPEDVQYDAASGTVTFRPVQRPTDNARQDVMTASLPIVIGNDFSHSPQTVSVSGFNGTLRASYDRLPQRTNSIRRSGYHAVTRPNDQQEPSPRRARHTSEGTSLNRRAADSSSLSVGARSIRDDLQTRQSEFESFSRLSRRSARDQRDDADDAVLRHPILSASTNDTSSTVNPPSPSALRRQAFLLAATDRDPMLLPELVPHPSSGVDTVGELLGSSSSTAALHASPNRSLSTGAGRPPQRTISRRFLSIPATPVPQSRSVPFAPAAYAAERAQSAQASATVLAPDV